jgi:nucleoid DNA-binding protein
MATRKTLSDRLHSALATEDGFDLTKKDAEKVTETFVRVLEECLLEDRKVSFRGFGTFELKARKERNARNPKTGDTIVVPAHDVVRFKPSRDLKQAMAD